MAGITGCNRSLDWEFADGRVCAICAIDGVRLKDVVHDAANSRIILQPFNMDYSVQIIEPDQSLDVNQIGVLSLQLRLLKVD